MSSVFDLISLTRAEWNVPASSSTDQSTILPALITACSRAIQRYCKRDFLTQAYSELYNGDGDRRLFLRQYPVQLVTSVRYRPVTVLKITNTSAANQQARVRVTSTGLTLSVVNSGVLTTQTVAFSGHVTITSVATAVTALGNGWSGQFVAGYDQWPSADLYCPNGPTGATSLANQYDGQGNLTAVQGIFAELKMHTYELAGYQFDSRRGWLLRAIPYTDPELLHPEDLIWPTGINNFRIDYTAGYGTVDVAGVSAGIPDDVQEACAQWVAELYYQSKRDPGLQSANVAGAISYSRDHSEFPHEPPAGVATLLACYRRHTCYNASA